jgi:DNA (cytosine-5)-methyltransferase 1
MARKALDQTDPVAVVDLFCGIGGMTHGFLKEGFRVVAGVDLDPSCKHAFEVNNAAKFLEKDVRKLTAEDINGLYPAETIRILVGCAPCQPFSAYSQLKGKDEKWRLLNSFARLIRETLPDIVSMENVPRLIHHATFEDFVEALADAGYHVSHTFAHGPDYGIPQLRTRLVLLASLHGPIELLPPTHPRSRRRTVRHVIANLPAIAAGEVCPSDPLHQTRGLSAQNLRRIMQTPAGGDWRDWAEDLRLECHKREAGKTFRAVYGRMKWDEPGPTITTQCIGIGNGRFGHPEQNRAISLREAALLQTFPRYYKFLKPREKVNQEALSRHIGNAVPVRLGRIIARSIRRHLESLGVEQEELRAHD